jgi:hypothetical protein
VSDGVVVKMKLFVVLEKLGQSRLSTLRRDRHHVPLTVPLRRAGAAKSTTVLHPQDLTSLPRSDEPYILCRLPSYGQWPSQWFSLVFFKVSSSTELESVSQYPPFSKRQSFRRLRKSWVPRALSALLTTPQSRPLKTKPHHPSPHSYCRDIQTDRHFGILTLCYGVIRSYSCNLRQRPCHAQRVIFIILEGSSSKSRRKGADPAANHSPPFSLSCTHLAWNPAGSPSTRALGRADRGFSLHAFINCPDPGVAAPRK